MLLTREGIKDVEKWRSRGIKLPNYDVEEISRKTKENPIWLHFGAGNIFRGFIALLPQNLLNKGLIDKGIIAVESYDYEIIDRIYEPYDNLSMLVVLNIDGSLEIEVIGSISDKIIADPSHNDWERLKNIFSNPSLQIASFTITEKAYNLKDFSGEYIKDVQEDIEEGLDKPRHIISKVTSLLYERYKAGEHPIALLSLDNFSG
ncbi:MAG: mannitol dehydrogenase family protein, partial [Caldanaerobacter sp.]